MTLTTAQRARLQQQIDDLTAALAVDPPILPPPPPPVTGATIFVPAGANLQTSLDAALGGTSIELEAGAVYSGNFVFPVKSSLGPVLLRTRNGDTICPPGQRMTPALAAGLAKLAFVDPFSPVLSTADGAHDFTAAAIEVMGDELAPDRTSVVLGRLDANSLSLLPTNIVLDRMYIHGTAASLGHKGVDFNPIGGSIVCCDIRAFAEPGRDSQAILICNTPGQIVISNSYCEATGENIMVGGSDPQIANLVPSDISILGTWLNKPVEWKVTHPAVKNLLELKNAARVLIEGVYASHCWTGGQDGHGIQFTVRNQDKTAAWSTVRDVTMRYNVIDDCDGFAWNILGLDDQVGVASVQAVNLALLHNLCLNIAHGGVQMANGFNPTLIQHNTMLGNANQLISFIGRTQGLRFLDNVAQTGLYGVTADGDVAMGLACLNEGAPGHQTSNNVLETTVPWPQGNTLLVPGAFATLFDKQHRYIGTAVTTDGKPCGADIDTLIAKVKDYAW